MLLANSWLICLSQISVTIQSVWIYDVFIKVNRVHRVFFCGAVEGILNFTEVLTVQNISMCIHQRAVEHVLLCKCHFSIELSDSMIYSELPNLDFWPASIITKYCVSFGKCWSLTPLVFRFHICRVKELDLTNSFFPFLLKLCCMIF